MHTYTSLNSSLVAFRLGRIRVRHATADGLVDFRDGLRKPNLVLQHHVDSVRVLFRIFVQLLGLCLQHFEPALRILVDGILGDFAHVELLAELLRSARDRLAKALETHCGGAAELLVALLLLLLLLLGCSRTSTTLMLSAPLFRLPCLELAVTCRLIPPSLFLRIWRGGGESLFSDRDSQPRDLLVNHGQP